MFCAEMDGIESLREIVIILASNRPDLIDPAILRPGRIDRKIKVKRPNRQEALEILEIYLTREIPLAPALLQQHGGNQETARRALIDQTIDTLFRRSDEDQLLSVRHRSGQREILYGGDLITGAIIASLVQRAKERAIERAIQGKRDEGIGMEDLAAAIEAEYRDGEILPPDDAAEEWLKLLDHDPQQVVGISSLRKGKGVEKYLPRTII
jgi:proteasome-associated ATPase